MNKTYKLEDLDIYITNVESKESAMIYALICGFGVCTENLIEIEKVPNKVPVYGLINKPHYTPGMKMAIDPLYDY